MLAASRTCLSRAAISAAVSIVALVTTLCRKSAAKQRAAHQKSPKLVRNARNKCGTEPENKGRVPRRRRLPRPATATRRRRLCRRALGADAHANERAAFGGVEAGDGRARA